MDSQHSSYRQDLSRWTLLTLDEEMALARRMRRGDQEARENLICSNLPYAIHVAGKYRGMMRDHSDAIQAASLGLIAAVDKYRASHRVKVISYATKHIKQSVIRAIESERNTLHVSSGVMTILRSALRCGYNGGGGVNDHVATAYRTREALSLDAPEMMKLAAPDRAWSPEVKASAREVGVIVSRYLPRLDERQQKVLRRKYGLDGLRPMSFREIGRSMKVTHQRVHQIHDLALRWCRRNMELDRIDAEVEALVREIENAA